jgi:hypothetical protein
MSTGKKSLLALCIGVLLTLGSSRMALADLSWANVSASVDIDALGSTNAADFEITRSESYLTLWNSSMEGGDESDVAIPPNVDTSASHTITGAAGDSSTGYLHLYANAVATPSPDLSSYARVGARQFTTFETVEAGLVMFNLDLSYAMDLGTTTPGDLADGFIGVSVRLYSTLLDTESMLLPVYVPASISDHDQFLASVSGQSISVISPFVFPAGDTGYLGVYLDVESGASAAVVPVPAAVLLGALGLGTAGLKLRKTG